MTSGRDAKLLIQCLVVLLLTWDDEKRLCHDNA